MDTERLFKRPLEFGDSLVKNRKQTFAKGMQTGFHTLDQLMSFKKKYWSLEFAPPHVGKSVITVDILMAQAEMGRYCCIYSPEFREESELINALVQARLHKSFFGKYSESITDEMYLEALEFVNEHFILIIKPKKTKEGTQPKMSAQKIFREVYNAEQYYKVKFDFLFIDPANFIEKDGEQKFMETQDYVLSLCDDIAEYSKAMDLHTIVSAHTVKLDLVTDKDTGKIYYGRAHSSLVMGGQSWERGGYQIFQFVRLPEGVVNPQTGFPYPANYTNVIVEKSKPFGVGRLGSTGDLQSKNMDGLFFDPDTYTMYEIVDGNKYYRNEWYEKDKPKKDKAPTKSAIQPNINFGNLGQDPF